MHDSYPPIAVAELPETAETPLESTGIRSRMSYHAMQCPSLPIICALRPIARVLVLFATNLHTWLAPTTHNQHGISLSYVRRLTCGELLMNGN